VHPHTSDLRSCAGISGWSGDLLPQLPERLTVEGVRPEVLLENETNLAAVAELRTGSALGQQDFVLFWLDEGVGGAVVLGGRVRHGTSGGAGEFGMLQVAGADFCHAVNPRTTAELGDQVLAERIAAAAADVVRVLDPGLVVLGGSVGRAGGEALAARVANCLAGLTPVPTEVRATGVEDNAVLLGAVLTALDLTRERVFSPAS
jgi:predicted NBD/HSP70 family sugar kinase